MRIDSANPERGQCFAIIETYWHGRLMTRRSYPQGATLEEYRRIDREAVRAFGNSGTKTIGEFRK